MRHTKNSGYPKKFKPLKRESTASKRSNAHSRNLRSSERASESSDRRGAHRSSDTSRYVLGRNACREMLHRHQSRVLKCLTSIGAGGDVSGKEIVNAARARGIQVIEVQKEFLDEISSGSSHQGICLEVKEREFFDLHTLIRNVADKPEAIVLALDNIQDPQNLGSILRAAECFGVDCVIWSKNRGADLTPAAVKVSVGASEIVPIAKVGNLREAITKLRDVGFWIAATVISDDATRLDRYEFPEKTVLVMGGEGDGVQPLIAKEADFRVYIQQHGIIDSLNVSQATAVFLAEYRRQRKRVDKES